MTCDHQHRLCSIVRVNLEYLNATLLLPPSVFYFLHTVSKTHCKCKYGSTR